MVNKTDYSKHAEEFKSELIFLNMYFTDYLQWFSDHEEDWQV